MRKVTTVSWIAVCAVALTWCKSGKDNDHGERKTKKQLEASGYSESNKGIAVDDILLSNLSEEKKKAIVRLIGSYQGGRLKSEYVEEFVSELDKLSIKEGIRDVNRLLTVMSSRGMRGRGEIIGKLIETGQIEIVESVATGVPKGYMTSEEFWASVKSFDKKPEIYQLLQKWSKEGRFFAVLIEYNPDAIEELSDSINRQLRTGPPRWMFDKLREIGGDRARAALEKYKDSIVQMSPGRREMGTVGEYARKLLGEWDRKE